MNKFVYMEDHLLELHEMYLNNKFDPKIEVHDLYYINKNKFRDIYISI